MNLTNYEALILMRILGNSTNEIKVKFKVIRYSSRWQEIMECSGYENVGKDAR